MDTWGQITGEYPVAFYDYGIFCWKNLLAETGEFRFERIKNNEIHLIINTPSGRQSEYDDSYIRKAAVHYKIPYLTTMAAAMATAKGIQAIMEGKSEVKSLQEYHKSL